jgi:hypothetical protein
MFGVNRLIGRADKQGSRISRSVEMRVAVEAFLFVLPPAPTRMSPTSSRVLRS